MYYARSFAHHGKNYGPPCVHIVYFVRNYDLHLRTVSIAHTNRAVLNILTYFNEILTGSKKIIYESVVPLIGENELKKNR